MGWRDDVSDAVYLALCAVFKMNPQAKESMKKFVPAYMENTTNAQAPRNMNICYYAINEMQDSGFDYIQVENVTVQNVPKVRIKKTIPVDVLITFYGNSADDEAEKFWSGFQWDSGAESARAILRKRNIAPIGLPGVSRPLTIFEVEGTYHRRRCDVHVYLAYLYITDESGDYVDNPPEIVIDDTENN